MTKGEFYDRLNYLDQSWEIDDDFKYVVASRQYGKSWLTATFWEAIDEHYRKKEDEKVEPVIDADKFEAFLLEE